MIFSAFNKSNFKNFMRVRKKQINRFCQLFEIGNGNLRAKNMSRKIVACNPL